jgi:hypothetical protein
MKRRFMWRLASPDGNSVTGFFDSKTEMEKSHKQNPTWIPQRVLVIGR